MLDAIGANGAATLRGFRALPDGEAAPAANLGRALRGAAGRPERRAAMPRGAEIKLADAELRLQRQGMREVLRAMTDEARRLAEPAPRPRWAATLRLGNASHRLTSDSVAILQNLRQALREGSGDALDIRECAKLSLQLEKLAEKLPADSPLGELSRRLALQGQAAWAQLARADVERQLLPQFLRFDQPGAASERHLGVSVGVGIGLGEGGLGAKATVGLGANLSRGMDNDDEGFVFQNRGHAVSVQAGVKAGVGAATLSGAAEGRRQVTRFTEFNSAKAFVHLRAEQLGHGSRRETLGVSARTVVGALIRLFRPGHGNELRHYHRLQQQAGDQQQRVAVLLGWLGRRDASAALPGARVPVLPGGESVAIRGAVSARAAAVGLSAGVGAALERIDIRADALTPFWQGVAAEAGAARDPVVAAQRLAGIEQKAQALFDQVGDKPGARPLSRLTGGLRLADCPPEALKSAVGRLAAEFEHFCAVARQLDAGIGRREGGAQVEKSILASWQGKSREDALANMALAHAALLLAAGRREGADDARAALLEAAPGLYAPPIRHDAAALAERVSFRDTLALQIRDRSYALDLGGGIGPLGVKAEASLTERERVHPNPARAGSYKDVRVTLSGSLGDAGALDKLKDALLAQLAPHGLADQLPAALAGAQSQLSAQTGAGVTLLLRFYQPQYQRQADFPAAAAGYRLQLARVSASVDGSAALSGGVPLQPGVSLELGLSAGASSSAVLHERWGDNSLSAPMMHYLHLQAVGEPERWPALRESQREALSGLFRQLADDGAAVHQEAGYFLARQPQDGFGERFFAAMRAFASGSGGFDAAGAALEALLQRQYPLWQADKMSFPGLVELPLPA
ncbi:hypothetical protein [Chromobacterium subtsugae]|uniref:hypothetical protein n=1 Tax=Chromobacterium subtsugae TaxID=251747 RepID=UPI0006418663|nr:hypothetical protein [Chromobacterium subtsugae]